MPPTKHARKRRRSTSKEGGFSLHSLEQLFSKQVMRLVGILFLGASLWFAANSADTLFKVAKNLVSPRALITTKSAPVTSGANEVVPDLAEHPSRDLVPLSLSLCAILAGWIGLQLLSRWRKRAEFQIISVFLAFTFLLILVRSYGWNPPLLFSLLILMAAGLYFFGKHLSHTGTRLHFLFTWGLFSLWWLLKIMINGERQQLPSFFVLASLVFLAYHLIQLVHGFAGRHRFSHLFEAAAIALNPLLYVTLVSGAILKFYGKPPLFFLILALSGLYILSLVAMNRFQKPFRQTPFLIVSLVLVSLLLPLLFRKNMVLLLAGGLSVLLLAYSARTKNQPSIIVSLALAALMSLVYAKDLIFAYVPAAFTGGLAGNATLFYKGMIASLFIPVVAFTDRYILKKLDIRYSRKWFSRRRYRTLLKGVFLAGLYFGLFWIWQYTCCALLGDEAVALISWFSFHCLFFMVAIPWLAGQRSSFLSIAILVAVILTGIYPTLLSIQNLHLLDLLVRDVPPGPDLFPLHYIPAVLFLCLIGVVLRYASHAFKRSPLAARIFLVYSVAMILFLMISEMVLTGVAVRAGSTMDIPDLRTRFLGVPSSLIIFFGGIVLLAWGFLRGKRFGRTLALVIILLSAFKLIYMDMKSISLINRVILLFVTGSLFLALSLIYSRARRALRKKRTSGARHRKTPQFRARQAESGIQDQQPES